jgi:SagB-type dehydrogenase family enzyme
MRTNDLTVMILMFLILSPTMLDCKSKTQTGDAENRIIVLPEPELAGELSLEETLSLRRSVRSYSDMPLTLHELSQLLWAAQGITSDEGFRTAPSAGALYPLEIYALVGNVEGFGSGLFKYLPSDHTLRLIRPGDRRQDLFDEALRQSQIKEAAVNLVITAIFERTTEKYGERGMRYVHMEVGHVGQNICLQAQSLNLGVCPIGAFEDEGVRKVLGLSTEEEPLYILSIGRIW